MSLRTDYPNTNGEWVSPEGFPLVEIKSDGTAAGTTDRCTGGLELSQLSEGEKAAHQIQHDAYFDCAQAVRETADLSMFKKVGRPADQTSPEQIAYFDTVDAQREKDAAVCEAVLASGKYLTVPVAPVVEAAPAAPVPEATPAPTPEPQAPTPPAPAPEAQDPTPAAPAEPPVEQAPDVTISADAHQKSKGILYRIESFLGTEEKALVAELRALWKHV